MKTKATLHIEPILFEPGQDKVPSGTKAYVLRSYAGARWAHLVSLNKDVLTLKYVAVVGRSFKSTEEMNGYYEY